MEYWLSPALLESYDFITTFKPSLQAFGVSATFAPKYKFKNLKGKMSEAFLQANCFAGGKFCATENENFEPQSVLMEGVRQACIWTISQVSGGPGNELWWDYIFHYRNCLRRKVQSKSDGQRHCYDSIREELGMMDAIHTEIQDCIHGSFGNPESPYHSENRVLDAHLNNKEYADVYLVPAVFVNGNLVKEDLRPKIVMSALCNVLRVKPEICHSYLFANINWDYQHRLAADGNTTFLLAFIGFAALLGLALYFYFKRSAGVSIREEISSDVKTHVTEYMKLMDRR